MEVTSHKGMTPAAEHVVDQATKRAAEILQDTDRVAHRLARYYARRGNYAGSTFLDLNPNNPLVIEASDLFATTLLSVQIPPMAARNILEPGATSMYLTRLLNQDELAVDINLAVSTDATLAAMRELHVALKQALSPHNVSQSNRWVTASKLSAKASRPVPCSRLPLRAFEWAIPTPCFGIWTLRSGLTQSRRAAHSRRASHAGMRSDLNQRCWKVTRCDAGTGGESTGLKSRGADPGRLGPTEASVRPPRPSPAPFKVIAHPLACRACQATTTAPAPEVSTARQLPGRDNWLVRVWTRPNVPAFWRRLAGAS